MKVNRRHFIKTSVGTSLGLSSAPMIPAKPAEKFRTALIGTGWWGMNVLRTAVASGENRVVAICDVDENQLQPAAQEIEELSGEQPKKYKDYRELLSREKPDIAIVATPDHWHSLCMIAAVQAGAHVYVEKPISHTIMEGQAMVKTARNYDRVVQVGTHRRVSPHNMSGMEFLKSGKAGKIGMIRAFVHSVGGPTKRVPDSDPPPGLDWEMWCGPAPLHHFNTQIHPRGFRQFLDFANGTLGDWGIHWMDQILWWSEEKYPSRIFSTGGRHVKRDNTTGPDTQVASFEFESFTAVWEHRHYAANKAEKTPIGCYFYGTEGTFHMGWRDGWTFYPSKRGKPIIHEDPQLHHPDDQNIQELWVDFLKSIRQKSRPACDIEIGHRATSMSLLGMISLKLGRSLHWDGDKETILGDSEANRLLTKSYRKPWEHPRT